MTEADARLLAQDDVQACDAKGNVNPIALLALVAGGVVFLAVLGIWILLNRITGEFV